MNSYDRPDTLKTIAEDYGRWLCVLARISSLDPNTSPSGAQNARDDEGFVTERIKMVALTFRL
jgi:hypothetical protein